MKKKLMAMAAVLLTLAGTACAKDPPPVKDKAQEMPDLQGIVIVTEEVAYVDGCENCPCSGGTSVKCVCPDKTKCFCCMKHMRRVPAEMQKKCIEAKKADCAKKGIPCPKLIKEGCTKGATGVCPEEKQQSGN